MKQNQKVVVEYAGQFFTATIMQIKTYTKGYLWWKKDYEVAKVAISVSEFHKLSNEWIAKIICIEIPVSDLVEGEIV